MSEQPYELDVDDIVAGLLDTCADRESFLALRDEMVKVAGGGESPVIVDEDTIEGLQEAAKHMSLNELSDSLTDLANVVYGNGWDQRQEAD